MRGLFISGTSTDVGKTWISACLMAAVGEEVRYWKPVQTGLDEDCGDTATVQRLAHLSAERVVDRGVRLGLPASPHHAAAVAGTRCALDEIVRAGHALGLGPLLVEGAGGLLVPLNDSELVIDIPLRLGLPVLLVASTALGTINHTLLSLAALQQRGLQCVGVVLNGPPCASARSALAAHGGVPLVAEVPWHDEGQRDIAALQRVGRQLLAVASVRKALLDDDRREPAEDLAVRDRRVVWHPFTQAQTAAPPLAVRAAQGAWLTLADGRRVLDGVSSWWTCTLGHCDPYISSAVARQAATLDHVLLAGATHAPAVEVAERLVALAPRGLTRVFFSDDGSTAVEVALRIAVQAQAARGEGQRQRFLALGLGYHGDTLGAASVGDPSDFGTPLQPRLAVDRVPPPPPLEGWAMTATCDTAASLEALDGLLAAHGPSYAALILEPMIQGAGGMVMHPPAYVQALVTRCRAAGLLVICDEVMTGFGRSGSLWASTLAGIKPDLLCLAKGLTAGTLPLAATLATEELYACFLGDDLRTALLHGHSFTGNPIACAAALANLRVWQGETAREVEAELATLQATHGRALTSLSGHPRVARVRWLGGIGALDVRGGEGGYHASQDTRAVAVRALQRGVLVRPLGPTLYLMPPYCTTADELAWAWRVVGDALDDA